MRIDALEMTPVKMHAQSNFNEATEISPVQSFGEYLEGAIKEVDALEKESERLGKAMAAGQVEDISEVIIASEKADIAVQLTLAVRNRAVDAYQEIMRMQV